MAEPQDMIAAIEGLTGRSADELIDRQYAGAKAGLRPIYERVAPAIQGLGEGWLRAAYDARG